MYPDGKAICGAFDLAGNLYEWCLNRYYEIPYHKTDESTDSRVLRGGTFFNYRNDAAAAYRHWHYPNLDLLNYGCRLVVVPNESLIADSCLCLCIEASGG
jgi:formylglycine-generating enzyme required for sulfatase activity